MTQVNIQQFSALIHQIQGPENYTPPSAPAVQSTVATASDTQLPLLPISYPPTATALPVTNPPSTSTTTPQPAAASNNPTPTFFAFVVHHIRTDPQARLCMSETVNI